MNAGYGGPAISEAAAEVDLDARGYGELRLWAASPAANLNERFPATLTLFARLGPAAGHEIAVPTLERGGSDEERRPAGPGQQPGQGREHRPIGGFQVRAVDLTAQPRDLMPQYEYLDVLGPLAAHALDQQVQQLAQDHVPERQNHAGEHASRVPAHCAQMRTSAALTVISSGTGTAFATCDRRGPWPAVTPDRGPFDAISLRQSVSAGGR